MASDYMYMTPVDDSSSVNTGINTNLPNNNAGADPSNLTGLEEKDINAVSTIENEMLSNDAAYLTDLGYLIDKNSRLTLRDLGQHMSERMLEAMNQEKINKDFSNIALGSPDSKGDNPVTNIFKSLFDAQDSGADYDLPDESGSPSLYEMMKSRYGDYLKEINGYKKYAEESRGIQLGESNVLNPPFMFNEIDDVRSDFRRPKLGRTYSEEIYDFNMPIVYFQPGMVSVSTAGVKFMSSLINKKTQAYQQFLRGDGSAIKWAASKLGAGANAILSFGAKSILDKAQWFKWTPNVAKYLHFVNDILIELATWLGLIGGNYGDAGVDAKKVFNSKFESDYQKMRDLDDNADNYDTMAKAFDDNSNNTLASDENDESSYDEVSLAKVESKYGYMGGSGDNNSVLSALRCLPVFQKLNSNNEKTGKEWQDDDEQADSRTLPNLVELAIPFAMDKGAQSSESFSNSIQAHPLVDQYNRMYDESNQTSMQGVGAAGVGDLLAQGKSMGESALGFVQQSAKDAGQSILASHGLSSEAGMVAGGLGRFVLPEVWNDSTFDKSYSISMKLRSVYGHRLSIFENEFIPLAFLIAMSAPRKIGLQSYTSPFYVKMFAKGLFSVPMGMITSLSITRGEDNNDRTVEGFFRTTTVNISVKDVLPNLAAGLGGGSMSIMNASNLGMNNYLFTLCGIDFIERASLLKMFDHKIKEIGNKVRAYDPTGIIGDGNTGRSNALFAISNSFLGRNISRIQTAVGKSDNPYATTTPKEYY